MIGKMVEPSDKFLKYNFSITNAVLLAAMNVLKTFKSDNVTHSSLSENSLVIITPRAVQDMFLHSAKHSSFYVTPNSAEVRFL
jgi:hypothetical protein